MLKAPKMENTKVYEPTPAGNHVARLYSLIQIGTVEGSFEGVPNASPKVWLSFELPNELKMFKEEDGPMPIVIGREFTLSMAPKANLRKFIEGMLGTSLLDIEADEFDVESVVGKSCLLNVIHVEKNGKVYANIMGASPLPKGMSDPVAVNKVKILTYQNWNADIYESLPNFIKDKMATTPEMAARVSYKKNPLTDDLIKAQEDVDALNSINPEDIPF